MEHLTLHYREGSSDKVYQASILPKDNGFMVLFAYGRRGATLNAGSKTQIPVPYQDAKSIYDKLINEKLAKGYKPGAEAPQYTESKSFKQSSGVHCQLLSPVTEDRVEDLLNDRVHWMQEKKDGRRLLVKKEGRTITGINRLGLVVAVPQSIMDSAANYPGDFIIDGEAVGDVLYAFDLLVIGEDDVRAGGFDLRYRLLRELLNVFNHPHIQIVHAYCSPEKRQWFDQFKDKGREGVVFKHCDAPYVAGKPNAGGTQLKHKFYETASFIVAKVNTKRSVSLLLFEGDRICSAGNVTIPPNHVVPPSGTVVEVGTSMRSRNQAASISLSTLDREMTSGRRNASPNSSNTKLSPW